MRRALGVHAERFAILSALMDDAHPSHEKHRYMPFIAEAPGHQRGGIATRLLADRLAIHDATGTASYLEASCPGNQKLYERLGFRPTGGGRSSCPAAHSNSYRCGGRPVPGSTGSGHVGHLGFGQIRP
jgi:hypothetical protein